MKALQGYCNVFTGFLGKRFFKNWFKIFDTELVRYKHDVRLNPSSFEMRREMRSDLKHLLMFLVFQELRAETMYVKWFT